MTFDPLAVRRTADEPAVDVFLQGTVFLDIVFTGLSHIPKDGTEVWADGMGSCPGGIANLAVAAARLGLRTSLGAAFGDDDYGQFCWQSLEDEGVALAHSKRYPDWHSPVTVSLASGADRRMVTHGHQAPEDATAMIGRPPRSSAVLLDLDPDAPLGSGCPDRAWADQAREGGARIFADVGWDQSEHWSPNVLADLEHCYAFTPNAVEAMAYTRTESPQEALYAIADRVPLAVVTNGSQGVMAIDNDRDEEVAVPALRVPATDPTGAGDVFAAALLTGTLAEWPLANRLHFAGLCSALSVQQFGGSLAAPGWGDIADWWHHTRAQTDTSSHARSVRRRYAFLDDIIPTGPVNATRRAAATIARLSDA